MAVWKAAAAVAAAAAALALLLLQPDAPAARECARVDASTLTESDFHLLVQQGQPALLVGADSLPELRVPMRRWRERDYLLQRHGGQRLQVSLSASEVFEGVEPAQRWAGAERFWAAWRGGDAEAADGGPAPQEALSVPGSRFHPCRAPGSGCVRHVFDRVVVRPATTNASLRQILSTPLPQGVSAYVQYEELPTELARDVRPPAFAAFLRQDFAGVWLGRGRTVAQLHHDANENIVAVLRGSKRFQLFPPSAGDALHEGYMLEVQQKLRRPRGSSDASADESVDAEGDGLGSVELGRAAVGLGNASLSFFTSPVGLGDPDHGRFPLLRGLQPTECTVQAGDALFIPSWWWHAVDTTPEPEQEPEQDPEEGQGGVGAWSAALNLWFEPFYVKSFGCAACERRPNPLYAGLDRPP